jgi:hypothetical protein
MRLVYYSLVSAGDNFREEQLVQSLRSLRRHNHDVAVCIVTYGGAPDFLLDEARRCRVAVFEAGDYHEYLQRIYAYGDFLALNPIMHKLLSLRHLPLHDVSQLLYLDCDTFFFQDVNRLFDAYNSCHWYAREEPSSRHSHLGYDRSRVDESALHQIAMSERLGEVVPYNTGVCLMNFGLWWRLIQLEITFLELAWRLMIGIQLWRGKTPPDDEETRNAVLGALDPFDRARALPFPSTNFWILEEVALWLTLGHIPRFTQGYLKREHVMQGGEFVDSPRMRNGCILAHYFSCEYERFFANVTRIRRL